MINGAGFATGSTVSFVRSDGIIVAYATTVTASNPNTLLADFDLTGVPVDYSLKIITGRRRP